MNQRVCLRCVACCVDPAISIHCTAAPHHHQNPQTAVGQEPADESLPGGANVSPPGAWMVQHNGRGFGGASVVYQRQVAWIVPPQTSRIISCRGWLERPCRLDVAGEPCGRGASRPGCRPESVSTSVEQVRCWSWFLRTQIIAKCRQVGRPSQIWLGASTFKLCNQIIPVKLVLSLWAGDVTFGVIAVTLERVCVVVTVLFALIVGAFWYFTIDCFFWWIKNSIIMI